MAEQYANCTVHHKMHSDRRFDLLGELGGWTRNDASFRMVQLWARCTAMQTDRPPAIEIRAHLGLRGEELLLTSGLGERCPDGSIRVLGGGLTGGDTDRFSWYEPLEARNTAGGLARAEQVRRTGRGPRGRFAPAGASDHQQPDQRVTSDTSDPPAIGEAPPASGFRISEEDRNSLSRAIPPTPVPTPVPEPDTQAVQVVQQPAGGARAAVPPPAPVPPGESAWHRRMRWWGAMLEADARIRAAGIEPNAQALPKNFAGPNELNLIRCERFLVDSGYTPDEVDAKMLHIVLVAEAEAMRPDNRSRKFFKPALMWDPERANRQFDTSIGEASRPRAPAPRRGDPPPPAPAPPRPERPPPDPVLSAEDRAAIADLAARVGANPEAAAAELAGKPANLPTAELVKRFGDGQRAPPASATPTNSDDPTRRRKAAT